MPTQICQQIFEEKEGQMIPKLSWKGKIRKYCGRKKKKMVAD